LNPKKCRKSKKKKGEGIDLRGEIAFDQEETIGLGRKPPKRMIKELRSLLRERQLKRRRESRKKAIGSIEFGGGNRPIWGGRSSSKEGQNRWAFGVPPFGGRPAREVGIHLFYLSLLWEVNSHRIEGGKNPRFVRLMWQPHPARASLRHVTFIIQN